MARAPWGQRVYRYFSLSNLASLLSLLCYPLLGGAERGHGPAGAWAGPGLMRPSCCCARCGDLLAAAAARGGCHPAAARSGRHDAPTGRTRLDASYLLWLALPGLASWLLLAITNHLTQNVAAIPFLWVLPLTVYLLSFVLSFESDRWYRRGLFLPLTAAALLLCAYGLTERLGTRVTGAIPLYTAGLFVLCMFLHGELARMRPGPRI